MSHSKETEKKDQISRREFIATSASLALIAGTKVLGCGEDTVSGLGRLSAWPPVRVSQGPLLYAPTAQGISCNMVAEGGRDRLAFVFCRQGENVWTPATPSLIGTDVIEWQAQGLSAGTRYMYRIRQGHPSKPPPELFSGSFSTQAAAGASFTFDIISDSHLFVRDLTDEEIEAHPLDDAPPFLEGIFKALYRYWKTEAITKLNRIAGNVLADTPDFVIHLGDLMDFHGFAHNPPSPDSIWTRKGYLEYRELLGELARNTAHVFAIGNWEGENGWFTREEIDRARSQRLLYMPTPGPAAYTEGGSRSRDYYAFTWGDALFVVLNVMSYTPEDHPWHMIEVGADTWTLGAAQLAWLEDTLKNSTSKWKFIFIHHPVGGNGGNAQESVYGRGGGRAAYIGEQAIVHQWMREYGVHIFFYGHDHVFYDMVVDGIHYTLPGSAGAPEAWKFGTSATGYPPLSYITDSGHARVDVSPDLVSVAFINEKGRVINRFEIT